MGRRVRCPCASLWRRPMTAPRVSTRPLRPVLGPRSDGSADHSRRPHSCSILGIDLVVGGHVAAYVAFLRGINLGNRRVKMADLARLFEEMEFGAVSTFIASGNVLFEN